jgi:uncharacterized protein YuzE
MKEIEIIPLAMKKMRRRGIPKSWVGEVLRSADQVVEGHGGRRVVQQRRRIRRREKLLRVVFEETQDQIRGDNGISHFGHKTILEGKSTMKIEYEAAHDLLNIEFLANVPIDDSVEVDGVVVDYAKDKRIVAIEVLDASKRTTRKPVDLENLAVVKAPAAGAVREKDEVYGGKKKKQS